MEPTPRDSRKLIFQGLERARRFRAELPETETESALDLVLEDKILSGSKERRPPVLNLLDPAQVEPDALANLLEIPRVADRSAGDAEWEPTHPLLSYSFTRSPVLRRVVRVAGAVRRPFTKLYFAHASSGVEVECASGLRFLGAHNS